MRFSSFWVAPLALLFTFILSGCGNGFSPAASRSPASSEKPSYEIPSTIVDGLQFSATAEFQHRPLAYDVVASEYYRTTAVAVKARIQYAEFHIYNSAGTRIQQGNTGNGQFTFELPKTAGTYTLTIFSRSSNSYLQASVLVDIYNNEPHSISKSFTMTEADITAGTTKNIGTLTAAAADATLQGGAFNILHNLLMANEYIRNKLGKDTDPLTNWWVGEKVTAYWQKGFNPGSYYNTSAELSFYIPGEHKLFILGGKNGNVSTADTDHFDDSVVVHEYGHFIEDVYSKSTSPGGSHNGNFIIDPRLAWSEGFATFLQGAVLTFEAERNFANNGTAIPTTTRMYVDTYGYGSSGGQYLVANLLSGGRAPDYDKADLPYEGHFRELSISRALYKMTRSPSSTWDDGTGSTNKGADISFANFWTVLGQFRTSVIAPNIGEFHARLNAIVGTLTDWTAILTEEQHAASTREYAETPLTNCTLNFRAMSPTMELWLQLTLTSGEWRSNLLQSNDFFIYNYTGGNDSLTLKYSTVSGSEINMDLVVYRPFYVYQEDSSYYSGSSSSYIVNQSRREISSEPSCDTSYRCETVSFSGLAAGRYVINVKANGRKPGNSQRTSAEMNGRVEYSLQTNSGSYLCIN